MFEVTQNVMAKFNLSYYTLTKYSFFINLFKKNYIIQLM